MVGNGNGALAGPRHSLQARARAFAVILSEEFGTSFCFLDAETGHEVLLPQHEEVSQVPRPGAAAEARHLAQEGRCRVLALEDGSYHLALLLVESGQPLLLALGCLPGLGVAGTARAREHTRLQKWLQAVGDRLALTDQFAACRRNLDEQAAQLKRAWEVVLGVGEAVRHLRIHREPVKSQRSLLKAAHAFLGVQALVWVPDNNSSPVLHEGEARLADADCRHLAALFARHAPHAGKPLLLNADQAGLWAGRFPQIANLLAFPVAEQNQGGWLIAVNKRGADQPPGRGAAASVAFRRSDAAAFTPFVALFELQVRSCRRYQELKELLVGLTRSLTSALDAKDSYTFGHSERVARIAIELGRELGLAEDELSDIYLAGLLHDVGKIGVPDAVLCKTGPLTAEEFDQIKRHVTIGYHILAELVPLRNLLPGVLYHHERIDGKGYPDGLTGEAIPVLARVLAVADSYDAMSTRRSYRDALPAREVEEILRKGAGTQWDPRVIEAFARCRDRVHLIRQRGVGESLCHAIDGALRAGDSSRLLELSGLGSGRAPTSE
jgi:HD-GYP domain-containing protein (c-di-GMP phosphodiesterase class II)